MYISLSWLDELISLKNININSLIKKLTLGGFEVEEILESIINNKKVIILDITATANRSDSLSIYGIAKETAALLNRTYKINKYSTKSFQVENIFENSQASILNTKYYSLFLGVTAEKITSLTSPNWIKQKLLEACITPFDNLLDFQQYILLETGYPFEFYDLNKIRTSCQSNSFTLSIIKASTSQDFLASNKLKYKLNSNSLIVKANNNVLSIAGIIANSDFQYTSKTTSLLIEGAVFRPKKIRQTSRLIGLRTDRSARYEKGLNSSNFYQAFYRLLYLLKIANKNISYKLHTFTKIKEEILPDIYLKYKNVIEILGPIINSPNDSKNNIEPRQITNYLTRLDFKFSIDKTNLIWNVKIPKSRIDDITREIDLIEEIGRLHGFNNFITSLPKINKVGQEDFSYKIRKRFIQCFLNEGLNELLHYSLVKNNDFSTLKIINPLLSDCSGLRITLLPNLLKTVSNNLKQSNLVLEGFEQGRVFSGSTLLNYKEIEQVGGIFGGFPIKRKWSDNSSFLSWFEAKGKLENIFNKLNLFIYWKNIKSQSYKNLLHPYCTSKLYLNDGSPIGIFGQVHPLLAKSLNLPFQLYLFELNFEVLKDELKHNKLSLYKYYSLYPKILRDLSFIINKKISFEKLKNEIFLSSPDSLISIKLIDEYQGEFITENNTSLCIQLTFQSLEKTLINKEIEEIVNNIKLMLIQKFGITTRI